MPGSPAPHANLWRRVLPEWLVSYRRAWLPADALAGLVIWSVVVPQCVAYAQIAGLPPAAGLMAAPGALLAYALLGTSRSLVVSATTATSALSAATVGPLAHGDAARFAALSAVLALVTGVVLVAGGTLRLGALSDFVSKPVMTGFLFGLGLTITVGQLPKLLGLPEGSGNFFPRLSAVVDHLGEAHGATVAVGLASIAVLLAMARLVPAVPATLVVLGLAIAISAALGLSGHGVDVVGRFPSALPDPAWPDVSTADAVNVLPAAFGVLVLSAEAVGVARSLATAHHYAVDPNRDLSAMGASNLLAGLSSGFVQSGGASQTAAADRAGGQTQLATIVSAGLIVMTGAFFVGVFRDLPQATLAAIVIVAVSGFYRVGELRRFARLRRSAIVLALLALAGVLWLGVLPGLVITAGLSLMLVIRRMSRPTVEARAPDPATPETLVVRIEGALFYANAVAVKERILALAAQAQPRPALVVIDAASSYDLDVETLDALAELAEALTAAGAELRLASVHAQAATMLRRAGLAALLPAERPAVAH
jgi:SulP family sulfate permease